MAPGPGHGSVAHRLISAVVERVRRAGSARLPTA